MREWTNNVVAWGIIRRLQAGWEMASEGHAQRVVTIHQRRYGLLDDDNLYTSGKPLVDGCKTCLRRKGKTVSGAALVWNDNPKHCRILITQEIIPRNLPTCTILEVERFDL